MCVQALCCNNQLTGRLRKRNLLLSILYPNDFIVMKELKKLLNQENKTIIDVRETWEFEEKHFPGAINIPLTNIPLNLSQIRDMPKPILLYCVSGNRSGMAANMLKTAGIADAVNAGGLTDLETIGKN